jgi:hypothetical protein
MYKTITIFKNIKDHKKFKALYIDQLLPSYRYLPGCICTDVTYIKTINDEMSGEIGEIQYIIETHFESEETMNAVLTSPEIAEHMMRALQETPGDLFFYTGHTARVYSEEARKKFNKKDFTGSVIDDYSSSELKSYNYHQRIEIKDE